jgi:hypothetical protein
MNRVYTLPGMTATSDELDSLSTEELRKRAFHRAERHGDIGFFWDLVRHLPSTTDVQTEDGSLGSVTYSISELVELVRELMGKDLGDAEPILRARFLDYLRSHPDKGRVNR